MSSDYTATLEEAEHILLLEPNESIKIATHIAENPPNVNQNIQANLMLYTAYFIKGE
jgi:hypothetical protein